MLLAVLDHSRQWNAYGSSDAPPDRLPPDSCRTRYDTALYITLPKNGVPLRMWFIFFGGERLLEAVPLVAVRAFWKVLGTAPPKKN